MSFLGALFGELRGVLGKAFLLAGLLPAFVLLTGWMWFEHDDVLAALVEALGASGESVTADVMIGGTALLGLGLAFFAVRSFAVQYFQTLSPAPKAIRRWLIRRQLEQRAQASYEVERLEHHYSAVRWACDALEKRRFYQPVHLPDGRVPRVEAQVVELSRQARNTLEAHAIEGFQPLPVPTWEESERIADGLAQLYTFAKEHHDTPACRAEVTAWRELVGRKPWARAVLESIADGLHGETNDAKRTLDSFPERPWVRPTALGSRASALDDYGAARYRISTAALLSRLTGVLDSEDRDSLADSRLAVEVFVTLSLAMIVLSLASAGDNLVLVLSHAGTLVFDPATATFIVGSAVLAVLFYRSAILAYELHSVQVKRMVDLHRLELIKQLGFETPTDVEEERALWKQLSISFEGPAPGGSTRILPEGDAG